MKRLTAFLVAMIFLLIPINAFAEESRFDTAHDMYNYFSAHNNFPDYFCGMWSTDGTMYNLTISVLNNEEGEKGKQEILDWVRNDEGITFAYGKYSLNFLNQVQDEAVEYFKADAGVVTAGVYDDRNLVEVGILEEYKDNDKTKQIIASLTEKYGDAVSIYYTGPLYFTDDKLGIENTVKLNSFANEMNNRWWFYIVVSITLILTAAALWFAVAKQRKNTLVTADGHTIELNHSFSDKYLEAMVKNSGPNVPSDLKAKILKEIETRN